MSKHRNENRFLEILREHLNSLNGSPTIKDVCEYLAIKEDSFKTYFPNPRNKNFIQKPFPKKLIRLLYFGFQIPYRDFLLSKEERKIYDANDQIKKKEKSLLFLEPDDFVSEWGIKPSDVLEFHHLAYSTSMTYEQEQSFLKTYPETLNRYIPKTENLLAIYEYLGKGSKTVPMHLQIYGKAHESIFKIIEDTFREGSKMFYTRYLALPYKNVKDQGNGSFEDAAQEALSLCSVPLFKHMCRCLKEFPVKRENKTARFYIVPTAWWPYHIGIINTKEAKEERIILSEYFRYSRIGGLLPNFFFIESVNSKKTEILFNVYKSKMTRYSAQYNNRYFKSPKHFKDIFDKAYNRIELIERNEEDKVRMKKIMDEKKDIMEEIF